VKKFDAIREDGGDVKKLKFKNELEEISWIIDDIASQIESGVPANNIAIITKKNKTLELIAKGLLEKNIPVSLSKDESIFDTESIQLIINILKVIDSLN